VDSLRVLRTGNVIFLRVGERWGEKTARMKGVGIRNVYAEVPVTKPDAGYEYEGPVEDMPRNISPVVIAGLPEQYISDVVFSNIDISYPGGGTPFFDNVPLDKLDSVPEIPTKYPDFSMFKELPAWGIYVRHAKGLQFNNVTLRCEKKDYRLPIVLDDVHQARFSTINVIASGQKKIMHTYKSTGITTK